MNLKLRLADSFRRGMIGAGLTVLVGVGLWFLGIGQPFSYDFPFVFVSQDITNDVIIVKMDEVSNSKFRQTASLWDRSIHARLLDKLQMDQSGMAIFDVWFADPGDEVENVQLARAIKDHGNVVLAAQLESLGQPRFPGINNPTLREEFSEAARAWGIMDVVLDPDSAIRRHHPRIDEFRGLAWAAAVLAAPRITNSIAEGKSKRWIRYYGPDGTIPHVSYYAALEKPDGFFKGKTVFIGGKTSVVRLGESSEQFRTPYTRWGGGLTSGVEIHATIFLNLIRGDWLTRLSVLQELSLILLAGLIFGYGLNLVKPVTGFALALIGSVAVTAFALWLWQSNLWFSWAVIAGGQIPGAWVCSMVAYTRRIAAENEKIQKKPFTEPLSETPTEPAAAKPKMGTAPFRIEIPNYDVLCCIGRGAFGEVSLSRNLVGTYHAIKVIHRRNFETAESYEREFKGIQKYMPISLKHPGLVQIFYVGRNDDVGYYYYMMEPGDDEVAGQTIDPETYSPRNLAKDLKKRGRIPVVGCVSMTLNLLEALDFLHQAGLIHRDIKPSNIIFVNGLPKLADIGLVTNIKRIEETTTGDPGTPGYMAREIRKQAPADIYSLGKVMYVATTGRDVKDFPALPDSLTDRTDMEAFVQLNTIILKACEENVRERYQSVSELRADLMNFQRRRS